MSKQKQKKEERVRRRFPLHYPIRSYLQSSSIVATIEWCLIIRIALRMLAPY
jgi:hypothetical protein